MRFCSLIACRLRFESLKILKLFKEICYKFAFYYVISWNQIQKRINFAKDFKLCYLLDIGGHCHRWCTVVYSGILCRCYQRDTGLNANWNNLRACLKTVIYSNISIFFTPTVDKKNIFDFFFWLITKCNNIWLC